MRNARTIGVLVGGALAASMFALPAFSANVTQERLNNAQDAEPHNWIHHHKNYFGWRHVPMDQINTGNLGDLKLAFTVAVGGLAAAAVGGRLDRAVRGGVGEVEEVRAAWLSGRGFWCGWPEVGRGQERSR